jgi:hypothetical protein
MRAWQFLFERPANELPLIQVIDKSRRDGGANHCAMRRIDAIAALSPARGRDRQALVASVTVSYRAAAFA